MPQLARITSTFFTDLINRLGIRPAFDQGFMMTNTVQPVSIVDANISIPAIATTILMGAPFTAGEVAVPGANTRLCNSGALAAGNYYCFLMLASDELNWFRLRRRNAADAADIWSQRLRQGYSTAGIGVPMLSMGFFITLAASERIVVENINAGGAGTTYQGSLWMQGPV